ncbi:MAG: hypothetical protein ABFD16_31025 [Thermoguttaceae bacterium]
MKWTTPRYWLVAVMSVVAVFALVGSTMAQAPAAPKVSTFAPAEDLVSQLEDYIGRLEESVANAGEYKDNEGKISRDANTVALIGLALGLHDSDNKYKVAAGDIVKAAQQIEAAKDHAAAKAAVENLKKATESKAAAGDLKWEKVASLPALMKQVPLVNTKLKRNLRHFVKKAKAKEDAAGATATLAVIAQGSMANASDSKKPNLVKEWCEYCARMRDAAGALNKAIHAGDKDAADAQMKVMTKACDDCHETFEVSKDAAAAE